MKNPKKMVEYHGDMAIGKFNHCPHCLNDGIEQVSICQKCGEPSEYLETLCDGCKGLIRDTLKEPVNFLLTEYRFDAKDVEEQFVKLIEGEEENE